MVWSLAQKRPFLKFFIYKVLETVMWRKHLLMQNVLLLSLVQRIHSEIMNISRIKYYKTFQGI